MSEVEKSVFLHRAGYLAANQLPNEVLFHVFVLPAEDDRPRKSNGNGEDGGDTQYRVDIDIPGFKRKKLGWMKLVLVCRRWRDVAIATPALWRTIDVARTSSNWMKLALDYSGHATIDVSFPGDSSAVSAETWTALFCVFPALVSLEAEADSALFTGFHEASLSNSVDEEAACRGLERMVLKSDWSMAGKLERVLDPLIRCLRYRVERGSKLQVSFALPKEFSALKVHLAQLEELVPNLEPRYPYALGPS